MPRLWLCMIDPSGKTQEAEEQCLGLLRFRQQNRRCLLVFEGTQEIHDLPALLFAENLSPGGHGRVGHAIGNKPEKSAVT